MPLGKGKYDDLCTQVREAAKARAAIVIVFEGEKGSGFSVQSPPALLAHLPALLRNMADQIEHP